MSFIGFQVDVPFDNPDGPPVVPPGNNTTIVVRPTTRTSQPPPTVVTRLSRQSTAPPPPADTWFSNLDKLADGEGVGIDWTSSNLNHPWFGGSPAIPNTAACNGQAWRQLIANALYQVSSAAC
jgi:hypothetical protein